MRTTSEQAVLLVGGSIPESKAEPLLEDRDFAVLSTDELDIRIEEAVISLSAAIFARKWRLAFRHDPIFTPLAIEAVLDYWEPLAGEEPNPERHRVATPLLIFGPELDHDREQMEHAVKIGCLSVMKEADINYGMFSRVVCVGGAMDTENQIRMIREQSPQVPIFTIPSTGGAAHALADLSGIANAELRIVREIVERRSAVKFAPPEQTRLPESEKRLDLQSLERETIPQFRYALYPTLMDFILEPDDRSGSVPARRPI